MDTEPVKIEGENSAKPAIYKVDEYQQFLDFYTLPIIERKRLGYKNLGEWADKNGVHRNTISRWKAKNEFKRAVYEKRMEWGSDQIVDVLEGWRKACTKGNVSAIELWLAYFDGWSKDQLEVTPREGFAPDDVKSLIGLLPADKQKHYYLTLAQLVIESEEILRK